MRAQLTPHTAHWAPLFLVILTVFAACIETDIYLPAFADMMEYFKISEDQVQSTLTWNFIGLCVSGPFYGPLSDALGRKPLLLGALSLFFLGSLCTVVASSFETLLLGRVLQGLGSGGCFTLGTAIMFDIFDEKQAARAMGHLNTAIPLLMAGAPLLGGLLTNVWGFRANFMVIAASVFVSLAVLLASFNESLLASKRTPFSLGLIVAGFSRALSNKAFWQLTLIVSLLFAGYLVFLSSTAVLFVVDLGVPKNLFPFYQVAILGAYVLGSLLVSPVSKRFSVQTLSTGGLWLIGLGFLGLVGMTLLAPTSPLLLTLPMMAYAFGSSWAQIPYWNAVMFLMPEIKGITASLVTSCRMLLTAGLIGGVSGFYNGTIWPTTLGVGLAAMVSLLLARTYRNDSRNTGRLNI